ncbi:hypothetical protein [Zophobihabitans entericus]|uniref:Uncharacterized protein n=1 Tax=Zophobihabitans entericus TaxID=1635327 RepID=A0A6G9ICP2_9GAMM|nr:hypothetical protein [Zophobihabitans entericus]QIQ22001.1 hypothetical protein IPMB12_10085 [Zophobihabitans entericus]
MFHHPDQPDVGGLISYLYNLDALKYSPKNMTHSVNMNKINEFNQYITPALMQKLINSDFVQNLQNYEYQYVGNKYTYLFEQDQVNHTIRISLAKSYRNTDKEDDFEIYHYILTHQSAVELFYQSHISIGDNFIFSQQSLQNQPEKHYEQALARFKELVMDLEVAEQNYQQQKQDRAEDFKRRIALLNTPRTFKAQTIQFSDYTFDIIDAVHAFSYIKELHGVGSDEKLYDAYSFELAETNSCFLLAKDDVNLSKFDLSEISEQITDFEVQGIIFLKNLHIQTYLMCEDLDFSPAVIVLGNLSAKNMHFCGHTHYIGGNVRGELIYAKYNHGKLHVHGGLYVSSIIAVDMKCYIGKMHAASIISRNDIYAIDDLLDEQNHEIKKLSLYPSTHIVQDILMDDISTEVLWDMDFPEDSDVIDAIINNKSVIDTTKNSNYSEFTLDIDARFNKLFNHPVMQAELPVRCKIFLNEGSETCYFYNHYVYQEHPYREIGFEDTDYHYRLRIINRIDTKEYVAYLEYLTEDNQSETYHFISQITDNFTSTKAAKLALNKAIETFYYQHPNVYKR